MPDIANPIAVLFRVGWAEFYNGNEDPVGGGSWNTNEVGGELYNFLLHNSNLYGYVRASRSGKLNICRVDPGCELELCDNALVVWVATHPTEGGQRVIGWYRNATLYRNIQDGLIHKKRGWHVKCRASDATLLPVHARVEMVPSGALGMGQSNVRFLYDVKGEWNPPECWQRVADYIDGYAGENLITDSLADVVYAAEGVLERAQSGQGRQLSAEERSAVEWRAMKIATSHYEKLGWQVDDSVHKSKPYDLRCTRRGQCLTVEVKGTKGNGASVLLTRNEVLHARSNPKTSVLCVVSDIKLKYKNKSIEASGGELKLVAPFDPKSKALEAIAYHYQVS